jgi:hypothetical protein
MAKDVQTPAPQKAPHGDPNPSRRTLGKAEPEHSQPEDEDLGIEIDNAIERPREGQPGERGKAN